MDDRLPYADTLVAEHRGQSSPATTELLPTDYASAMRIQRDVTRALGATVAGWKVGFSPDGVAVAGPLYASVVRAGPASVSLHERGFIVEIELAFRLARDLPGKSYTRDEILAAIDDALIGIELIAGRRGEPPAVPYPAFLADNLGNAGYVTGASTRGFRALDLKALPMRFTVDGAVVQEGRGGHPQGDPVEPLRAYASRPNDQLGGLRKGQLITTGSLTKLFRIESTAQIEASLEGVGSVVLDLRR
jgi:2-keto-4-pentenoate hydratase